MGLGRRRIGVLAGAGVMAVGGAALVVAAVGVFSGTPAAPSSTHQVAVATTTTTTTTAPPAPPGPPASTLVATTDGAIPGYASPESATPSMTVPGSWFGYPSELPVITSEPGWLYVRLAQRPNGSTIWVRQSDVTLSSTPYAIVVNLTTMHLQVFDNGAQIFDFPAGIGAPDDPTPPGQYFMPMQYPPPGPGIRSLRPRHVGPLRHHRGLGEHRRRGHRDPRADHLLRRLVDRDDGRRHFARVHTAPRRRPGAAFDHPARHADRHRELSARPRNRAGAPPCHISALRRVISAVTHDPGGL